MYVPSATGLGWFEDNLYSSSTFSGFESCEKYDFFGTAFGNQTEHIDEYSGSENGFDIALLDGNVWMATDNDTSPLMCYQEGSGSILAQVPATLGIGGEVRGVALESDKIWISNTATDELYRIAEVTSIGSESTSVNPFPSSIEIQCNPFRSAVRFSAYACGTWHVEIFDPTGRAIYIGEFTNSMVWNPRSDTVRNGLYLAIFTSSEGIRQSAKLIKY